MKAIAVHLKDNTPELVWEDAPDPDCGPEDVIVDIAATAVNRADLAQARGLYPPPAGVTDILGLEFAGTIAAVGEGVPRRRTGDRVCALTAGGGYAERIAVHHGMLLEIPDDWTFETAAAVPEVWLTAFSNLFMEAGLGAGGTVLIHAGGSGVGTAAIQLAVSAGATAMATAGTGEKLDRCRELGAALAIHYKTEDFAERIRDFMDGGGVDVILDPIGAPYLGAELDVLNPGGRLIHIGILGGRTAEIDLGLVLGKSLTLKGTRLRGRPLPEKLEIVRRFRERFWPLLLNGDLRPVIDTTFPIREAGRAHQYVKENRNIGKVILTVGEPARSPAPLSFQGRGPGGGVRACRRYRMLDNTNAVPMPM